MFDKIKKKLGEVSTWGGLASLILGFGMLFDADHTAEIAGVVDANAESLASGDITNSVMAIGIGLVGIFAKENTKK